MADLRHRHDGFSLLELVLVLLVTALLAGMVAPGLRTGTEAWRTTSERLAAHRQLRLAMERMLREFRAVRHTGTAYDFLARTAANARFRKTEGGILRTVDIGVNGSALVIGYDGGTPQPLATGVTSLRLDWLQADGATPATSNADVAFVEITLTLTDASGRSYTQAGRAAFRRQG